MVNVGVVSTGLSLLGKVCLFSAQSFALQFQHDLTPVVLLNFDLRVEGLQVFKTKPNLKHAVANV